MSETLRFSGVHCGIQISLFYDWFWWWFFNDHTAQVASWMHFCLRERARYLSRDFSRDIFMIWRNYLSHLLSLPTLILDRAVGCRCAHNWTQIEAQLMKANSITARRNPRNSWMRLSAGWEAPKQSNDSALSSKDILFWVKGQKSGFLWEPVEIQSCERPRLEDKVKISG